MDILSHLLYLHPVRTRFDTRCILGAPSVIEKLAEAPGVAPYHLVVAGRVSVQIAGKPPVVLAPGDLVILPRGHAHRLSAAPDGSSDRPSEILCGQFRSIHVSSSALLEALPDMALIHAPDHRLLESLRTLMQMLGEESLQALGGAEATRLYLASALFSILLDTWMRQAPDMTGLLALLAESRIRPALQKMLAHPGAECSIDQMAAACHLSRSTFLRLFRHAAGSGPAEVLQRLRMAQAEQWLARGDSSIARIADAVGYQSESSFNKPFKRYAGTGPGEYRRRLAHER